MKDITSYFITEVFKISMEEAFDRIFKFYQSEEFAKLPAEKDALEAVKFLKNQGHELYIITSRDTIIEDMTREWVNKNFPGIFKEIVFTKQFSKDNLYNNIYTKSKACKKIKADMLVEDSPIFTEEVANEGIKVAFLTRPWNKNFVLKHKNIIRIKSLRELVTNFGKFEN